LTIGISIGVSTRSRRPDTLLIAVNEQLCSNSNPGRSAALKGAAPSKSFCLNNRRASADLSLQPKK